MQHNGTSVALEKVRGRRILVRLRLGPRADIAASAVHPTPDIGGATRVRQLWRIVKVMGDGVLVEFGSAVDAVRNGLAIQAEMARRSADLPEDDRIAFRGGINVGDVIIEGDAIHGDGVNVAARLEELCGPGEVYVSGSVFDQVSGKLNASFEDLGEQSVKNITRLIRVYRARLGADATVEPVAMGDALPS